MRQPGGEKYVVRRWKSLLAEVGVCSIIFLAFAQLIAGPTVGLPACPTSGVVAVYGLLRLARGQRRAASRVATP